MYKNKPKGPKTITANRPPLRGVNRGETFLQHHPHRLTATQFSSTTIERTSGFFGPEREEDADKTEANPNNSALKLVVTCAGSTNRSVDLLQTCALERQRDDSRSSFM